MNIDVCRECLLFVRRERRRWQAGEYFIQNEDLDIGLGLLFLPEPVKLGQPGLYGGQQVAARLLHPITGRIVQVILQKQIKKDEFLLSEPFFRRSLLLLVQLRTSSTNLRNVSALVVRSFSLL